MNKDQKIIVMMVAYNSEQAFLKTYDEALNNESQIKNTAIFN